MRSNWKCGIFKKNLNSMSYKYNTSRKVINSHAINGHGRGEKGEMILILAITIAISVMVLSVVAVNLSNIQIKLPSERSTSLVPEYKDVRESFGDMLEYSIGNSTDQNYINRVFDSTKNTFSNIEIKYGNYFNAELKDIDGENLVVDLLLGNTDTVISEEVKYKI